MTPPPGWRVAIDAERADQPVPEHVLARSGLPDAVTSDRALLGWTQAEVMAKLTDVPILLRVREFGLTLDDLDEYEPVALRSRVVGDFVVTVGARGAPARRLGEAPRA